MPVGLIKQATVDWERRTKFRTMRQGSVASLVKSFAALEDEAAKHRDAKPKPLAPRGRQNLKTSGSQQLPSASPNPQSSTRSNPFVRRDSTASPITTPPPPATAPPSSFDIPIQQPSPQRYVPTAKYESQARLDEWALDSRAGYGKRNTLAFANPAGRRTSRPWAFHSLEIEERRSSRPLVRRACGHLEPTATVPVPGGDDAPGMIEPREDGTYILVGPKLQDASEPGDHLTQPTAEIVPILCAECQKRQQVAVEASQHSSAPEKPSHMMPSDQDYWRDGHYGQFLDKKPRRRVSMSQSTLDTDAQIKSRASLHGVWSPLRQATPFSQACQTPGLSPITDTTYGPIESFPESSIVHRCLTLEILQDIDRILSEHTTSLNDIISNLQDEQPKVKRLRDLSRKLERASHKCHHSHETSPQDNEKLPDPPAEELEGIQRVTEPIQPVDEEGLSLDDPPKLLRRRTQSVPQLLRLIDKAATDLGLPLPPDPTQESQASQDNLTRPMLTLRRSTTDPSMLLQTASPITIHNAREPSTSPFRHSIDYWSPPSSFDVPRTESRASSTLSSSSRYSQQTVDMPRIEIETPSELGGIVLAGGKEEQFRMAENLELSPTSTYVHSEQILSNTILKDGSQDTGLHEESQQAQPPSQPSTPMSRADSEGRGTHSGQSSDYHPNGESETTLYGLQITIPRPASVESARRMSAPPKMIQDVMDEAYRTLASSYPLTSSPAEQSEFKLVIREPTAPASTINPETPSPSGTRPQPQAAMPESPPTQLQIVHSDIHGPDCPPEPHLHVPGDWEFPLQLYDTPAPPPPTPDERISHQAGQFWSSGLDMANYNLQELTCRHSLETSDASSRKKLYHQSNSPLSSQFWSTGVRNASHYLYNLSHHHSDSSHDVGVMNVDHQPPSYLQHDPARRPTPFPHITNTNVFVTPSQPLSVVPDSGDEQSDDVPVPQPAPTALVEPGISSVLAAKKSSPTAENEIQPSPSHAVQPAAADMPQRRSSSIIHSTRVAKLIATSSRRDSEPAIPSAPSQSSQQTNYLPPFLRKTPFASYLAKRAPLSPPSPSTAPPSSSPSSPALHLPINTAVPPHQAPQSEGSVPSLEPPSPLAESVFTTSELADDEAENIVEAVEKPRSVRTKRSGSAEHWERVRGQIRARSKGRGRNGVVAAPK